jgi:hypothetical protein
MNRLRRWSIPGGLLILTALALATSNDPSSTQAADKPPEQPQWLFDRSLTLSPSAEPVPALSYRLLPTESDLKDGDAVPIYLRLVHEQNDETRREWREASDWAFLPQDQLPRAKAHQLFKKYAYMMKQLDLGARRKTAEWNYTLDAGNPIEILLPDAQMMRYYGGLLALKARVEIAEGNYAAAAHTLETGFAFSRHVANGPFLISSLVGTSIAARMADALCDWVGKPDAPNLYWSLTALPRPLIDLRKQFDFERRMAEMQFPDLGDLRRERSATDWDAALKRIRLEFERIWAAEEARSEKHGRKKTPLPGRPATEPAADSPELPAAKRYVVERLHLPAAKVSGMPPAEVLLLYIAGTNDEIQDDVYKGVHLPAAQAIPVTEAALARMKTLPYTEANRIPHFFTAAVSKVILAENRLERKIAALRVIEAIRLHAVTHAGRLPDTLAAVTEVPLPDDPATGQPFVYRRDGDTATLTSRVPDHPPQAEGLRYRLTMRKTD